MFAKQGLDAGVEEIARVAGVGIGTLYRRFPTKDALIAALVQDVLDRDVGLAQGPPSAPTARVSRTSWRRRAAIRRPPRLPAPAVGAGTEHDSVRGSAA